MFSVLTGVAALAILNASLAAPDRAGAGLGALAGLASRILDPNVPALPPAPARRPKATTSTASSSTPTTTGPLPVVPPPSKTPTPTPTPTPLSAFRVAAN